MKHKRIALYGLLDVVIDVQGLLEHVLNKWRCERCSFGYVIEFVIQLRQERGDLTGLSGGEQLCGS